jgi:hypothetical protein
MGGGGEFGAGSPGREVLGIKEGLRCPVSLDAVVGVVASGKLIVRRGNARQAPGRQAEGEEGGKRQEGGEGKKGEAGGE